MLSATTADINLRCLFGSEVEKTMEINNDTYNKLCKNCKKLVFDDIIGRAMEDLDEGVKGVENKLKEIDNESK